MNLPVEQRFDVMMALPDSLPPDVMPVLGEEAIVDLERMVDRFRGFPEPSVQYSKVVERLKADRNARDS